MQEIPILIIGLNDILVKSAGICYSDAHYRAGLSPVSCIPLTLGHEVAGMVGATGRRVANIKQMPLMMLLMRSNALIQVYVQ